MDWSNESILEFIQLYKKEPAIWNLKDPAHNNRKEIVEAWKRIERSFSLNCSINELKRKKESLMATYRSLLTKMRNRALKNPDETYKPKWFAYDALFEFLESVYQPKIPTIGTEISEDETTLFQDTDQNEYQSNTMDDSLIDEYIENYEDVEVHSKTPSSEIDFPPATQNRNRKRKRAKMMARENAGLSRSGPQQQQTKDDCALYGELLVRKLRSLDELTRDVIMNQIDNLIFRAKLKQRNNRVQTFLPSSSSAQKSFDDRHSSATTDYTYNFPSSTYQSDTSVPKNVHREASPEDFSHNEMNTNVKEEFTSPSPTQNDDSITFSSSLIE